MRKLHNVKVWFGLGAPAVEPTATAVMTATELTALKNRVSKYMAACRGKRDEEAAELRHRLKELDG